MSMRWHATLAMLVLPCAAAHAARYELVDLSAVAAGQGHRILEVAGINNKGEVVGSVAVPAERGSFFKAFRLRDGVVHLMELGPGARAGAFSKASAVNDDGVVVGYGEFSGPAAPAIWEPGKPPRALQVPGRFASARSINRHGMVVGSHSPEKSALPFVSLHGEFRQIDPVGPDAKGRLYGEALQVNDSGQVIGRSSSPLGQVAFVWQDGHLRTLPPLPAHEGEGMNVHAYGINEAGQVVGCSSNQVRKETVPVLWDAGGSVRMLFDPRQTGTGALYGCAKGINVHGVVVGETWGPGGGGAFLWDPRSGYRSLHEIADPFDHGWVRLRGADAINDRGEIIGKAQGRGDALFVPYLLRVCEGWRCYVPGRRVQVVAGAILAAFFAAAWLWTAMRRRRKT